MELQRTSAQSKASIIARQPEQYGSNGNAQHYERWATIGPNGRQSGAAEGKNELIQRSNGFSGEGTMHQMTYEQYSTSNVKRWMT